MNKIIKTILGLFVAVTLLAGAFAGGFFDGWPTGIGQAQQTAYLVEGFASSVVEGIAEHPVLTVIGHQQ